MVDDYSHFDKAIGRTISMKKNLFHLTQKIEHFSENI
jgi:hypothetical protein